MEHHRTLLQRLLLPLLVALFSGFLVLGRLGPSPAERATASPSAPLVAASGGITDSTAILEPAPFAFPGYDTTVAEPVFGTTLRRVTDETADTGFGTHVYSQLQAFSPDTEYLLLIESGEYVVRRLDDLTAMVVTLFNTPRWRPTHSSVIVHYDDNADTTLGVLTTNVTTGETETIFTFPAPYERIRPNQSFDELSRDGRWMAGMASLADGDQNIFTFDLEAREVGAELSIADLYAGPCEPDPDWGELDPDWVGVSPLGRYLVVQWQRDGTDRCSGLETFDIESGAFVGRVYDGHAHGDLGLLPDGTTEMFMVYELYHPSGNLSIGYRELPGTNTVSDPVYVQVLDDWVAEHISCQGPAGVCLITTYAGADNGWSALEGEVFLQYTDGSVLRLAHHRSSSCGYWVEPRGSLSVDGRYVIFASDWSYGSDSTSCDQGNDLGAGEAYVVELDSTASPPSPPSYQYDHFLPVLTQ